MYLFTFFVAFLVWLLFSVSCLHSFIFRNELLCIKPSTLDGDKPFGVYCTIGPLVILPCGKFIYCCYEVHSFADDLYSNELQIICTVKKHILTGGIKRLPFTVPALVFSSLKVCLSWHG